MSDAIGGTLNQGAPGLPAGVFVQLLGNLVAATQAQTKAIQALAPIIEALSGGASTSVVLGGSALGVDLNATGDTAIPLTSPSTNYTVDAVLVQAASGAQGHSGFGVYGGPAQGGYPWSGGQHASSLAATSPDTLNAVQGLVGAPIAYSADATIYFNVGTAEGAASTANVYVFLRPLP
jgi:hypothetical protein